MTSHRISALRGQIAPITAITLFGISLAMSYPLFALMLERAGDSGAAIGLNAMAAALGMVIAAPVMPAMLRRAGMGPLMIGAALGLALMFLMIPLTGDFWLLTGLRLVYGFAATILFFASEFWIVATAPEAIRGRIVAIYALCVSGGFALGPAAAGGACFGTQVRWPLPLGPASADDACFGTQPDGGGHQGSA